MIFELQIFNPETFKKSGFKVLGFFSSEEECHAKALEDSEQFYRIEVKINGGSRKIFMSDLPQPPEPQIIPEPTPEPIPEPISEPEQPPVEE